MAFRDHIDACNTYRPERFLPLFHDGVRIGHVRRDNAEALRRFPACFRVEEEGVAFVATGGFDELTRALDEVVLKLGEAGLAEPWRHEYFAVTPRWSAPPICKVDRGAVGFFGIRSYGVHLNGWRRGGAAEGERLMLWIGKRAADKKVAPGKLDNLVAGGIGFGHGAAETLVKEAAEEAAIPAALIAKAHPVGAVTYRMETRHGLRDDVLFLYDLMVPEDFVPRNTDGEIAEFRLMPATEVVALVEAGDMFKFNVNLVILDFALRRGLVSEAHPDYLELITRLRRPLD